jgi:ribosomal protein S7
MIKSLRKNKTSYLKTKIVNTLMKSGRKTTGEKILLKSLKSLQKSTNRKFKTLLHSAIVNSASAFKVNEQVSKKRENEKLLKVSLHLLSMIHYELHSFKIVKQKFPRRIKIQRFSV